LSLEGAVVFELFSGDDSTNSQLKETSGFKVEERMDVYYEVIVGFIEITTI
jgi:hypothetical protein